MNQPLVCMTLTGKTLEEDLMLVKKYEKYIDMVELRVDFLEENEQLLIRRFPAMIRQPCILTIRRDIDGGLFTSGEFSRTNLFARALAFANQDKAKNFAYVDFEDDYHIPSIQDAALAFGVKIIRSYINTKEPVYNLKEKCDSMRKTGYEIPKIVFMPKKFSDVTNMFEEGKAMNQYEHIFVALGPMGYPSRVLASLTNSFLTYSLPEESLNKNNKLDHVTPIKLSTMYNPGSINQDTALYGIAGWPAEHVLSPEVHNAGYKKLGINAAYIPIRTPIISEAISFAERIGLNGLTITSPHKESVLYYVHEQSPEVVHTGSCNAIIRNNNKWHAFNTDVYGFKRSLEEFLGNMKIKRKKVAVIGAGEVAQAVVYALKQMGAKVCIFNRTTANAKALADKYGYDYCTLEPSCAPILDEYSGLIIQTTTVGSELQEQNSEINDPIHFYSFRGDELLFDIVCKPSLTPIMKRASLAGCRVCNGYHMLEYKAYAQFKLFTGLDFEENTNIDNFF